MSWMKALGCGVLCAAAGAACGAYIANECVTWYRISSREGASGYFVVFLGLVGLAVGGGIGLVTYLNTSGGPARQALTGLGIVLLTAASVWAIARAAGEVPPTLRGERLYLLAEIRCPAGWKPGNKARSGGSFLALASANGSNGPVSLERGALNWQDARVEEGRTVVPGEVLLDSASPQRSLTVTMGPVEQGFILPLPAKPAAEYEAWSEWLPKVSDADPVANGFRYRFRVQRESEATTLRESRLAAAREHRQAAFQALGPGSPLSAYLEFFAEEGDDRTIRDKAGEAIRSRAEELGPLLAKPEYTHNAVKAVTALNSMPESFEAPLRQVVPLIVEQIRAYRASDPKDPDRQGALRASKHFEFWVRAWENLPQPKARSFPAELAEIQQAATGVDESSEIAWIARRAKELLEPQ